MTEISKNAELQQSCITAVMRCCSFCQHFQHEEVGDSDCGGVYAKEASCSEYHDTEKETEEDIPNFDRNIKRECCDLDFFKVCEIDTDLSDRLATEMDETQGSFNETYKLFLARYNNA